MKRLWFSLVAVFLACSCSLGMRTTPDTWAGKTPPPCNPSRGRPIGDLVVAGALAATGAVVGAIMTADCAFATDGCEDEYTLGEMAPFLIPAALVAVASAVGFHRASKCRSDQARYQAQRLRQARNQN